MNKGKKFISLFLVFSILILSGNLIAKERRGAELIVQKKDGEQVRGELIAVKENSLLMLVSGVDVSVDISDISVIRIVKKSKFGSGAGRGFLIGTIFGIVLCMHSGVLKEKPGASVIGSTTMFGMPGLAIGGLFGAAAGMDEKIKIEGKSNSEIKEALEKLRKKARIPDYQ